jgi:nitrous oxidase accessory protein NosD
MRRGRLLFIRACVAPTLAVLATSATHAEILAVTPGDEWSALAARARPGDEIVLGEGVHRPAILEGLAGTAEQPIVIRPSKPGALVEIAPDREAIKLVDARHVRVERILVRSARRAGIVVEGSAPGASTRVVLADILVQGVRGLAEEAGIVVRDTDGFSILRSRLESCAGAGLHLERSTDGIIERCQVIARAEQPSAHGLRLGDGVRDLSVQGVVFGTEIGSALTIGVPATAPPRPVAPTTTDAPELEAEPATPGPPPPARTPAVEQVAITDCRAVRVGVFLTVGSARGVVVRNATVLDPHRAVYRLAEVAADRVGAGVRFSDNLVVWQPGGLRRIAEIGPGVDPAPFVLGANLWWSRELPAALPLLTEGGEAGAPPFPGTLETPQRIDIDPDLDPRGFPENEDAKLFGSQPA